MNALGVDEIAKGDALIRTLSVCLPAPLLKGTDELVALSTEVRQLHKDGKYADAIPLAERYVDLALQKHGKDSAEYAPLSLASEYLQG